MSKPFTYWVRLALVVTLCTITTFTPVYAGRWIDRLLHRDACKAPVGCCEVVSPFESKCDDVPATPCSLQPTSPCTPAPLACDSASPETTSVPQVEMEPAIATPETKLPKVTTPATETLAAPAIVAPAETTPVIQTPVEPPVIEVAPVVTPVPPKVEPLNPVVEPVPTNLEPIVVPPKTSPAADDLFGTEPAKPAPAEPAPAADDLFGTAPAKPAPAKPAPAADKSTKTAPDEPSLDELFKVDGQAKPALVPKKGEPSLDELFEKPISTTTDEASQSNNNKDDAQSFDKLFSSPVPATKQLQPAAVDTVTLPTESVPDPIETKTTTSDAVDSQPYLELDKLFGVGSFTPPPQFDGAEYRQWVDNTGAYSIKARLTVIYSDKIKLTKENGKTTTVPLSRLSGADFGYVQWVVSSLTGEQTSMLVKNNAAQNADPTR